VVAFGGRTVFDADPKYLNSPDTPVYSKGQLLYGLHLTKEAIREAGEIILVEGYTDFSALYQAGITNVAASLGTSLTSDQVSLAMRFASKVIINYDGDSAGKIATSRAISLWFEKEIEPKILILSENLDPDSFLRKYGIIQYRNFMNRSTPLLDFLVERFTPKNGIRSAEEKVQVALNIMKITLINPDTIMGSEYLKKIAERLGLNEDVVRRSITVKVSEKKNEETEFFSPAEKRLLQILLEDKFIARYVFAEMQDKDFEGLKSEPIIKIIYDYFKKDKTCAFHELCRETDPSLASHLSKALLEKGKVPTIEEALDCLHTLRKMTLQNRLKELQTEITRLERKGETDKIGALLGQRQDITKQILSL
jgi:DNA primase